MAKWFIVYPSNWSLIIVEFHPFGDLDWVGEALISGCESIRL